ncbi:hypothetical protein CKA32_004030 [Geitlerinema sp. FC II]|nr:hypothetical protein CKA32_004030 [Geitlerinema sp. FC II]
MGHTVSACGANVRLERHCDLESCCEKTVKGQKQESKS